MICIEKWLCDLDIYTFIPSNDITYGSYFTKVMGIRNLSIYAGSSFKIFGLGINVILDVLGDDAMCDIMPNQGIPNCVTPRVYKVRCMKYGSKDAYTLNVVLYFCPNIRITCQQYTSRHVEDNIQYHIYGQR